MPLIQLDFLEDTELSILKARMLKVEDSSTRCRKKQFAEIGEIKKLVNDINDRLLIIEKNICKGML